MKTKVSQTAPQTKITLEDIESIFAKSRQMEDLLLIRYAKLVQRVEALKKEMEGKEQQLKKKEAEILALKKRLQAQIESNRTLKLSIT